MEAMKEFTKPLTQFLSMSKSRLSAELIDRTKLLLVDYLGAYLAGQKTQPSRVLVTLEGKRSGNNILSAADSAFRYGVAAHALEIDDAHRFACVHPGSVVFSTALSLGNLLGSSGRDVILSVVAGYEAICRVAYGLDLKEHYRRGFHPTGTCGPFGAAATAANLLKLDRGQWESAFGIAGSMGAGSMQFLMDGTWTKPFHSGWAAHNGILAALLARQEFRGPGRILEGSYGFWKSHGEAEDKGEVLEGLGTRHELMRTTIKRYPCCGHTQSSISALVELMREKNLKPNEVNEVEIRLSGLAMPSVAVPEDLKRNPKTPADAMWSIYYGAAVTLLRGNLMLDAYEPNCLRSERVRRFMDKIRVVADPLFDQVFPDKWPSAIAITTVRGEKMVKEVDHPRGDPENFLSWDEASEKFCELSRSVLSRKKQMQMMEQVKGLEKIRHELLFWTADPLRP